MFFLLQISFSFVCNDLQAKIFLYIKDLLGHKNLFETFRLDDSIRVYAKNMSTKAYIPKIMTLNIKKK